MNAAELFLLGRKLMRLAEDALPQSETGTTVRLVLMDVAYNPGSSISEITERTGFLQSHVSGSIAKLRDLGVIATEVDPTDRRRTLVRITELAKERGRRAKTAPIAEVLAPALEDADVDEVLDALELLARRLMPKALATLRDEVASQP